MGIAALQVLQMVNPLPNENAVGSRSIVGQMGKV